MCTDVASLVVAVDGQVESHEFGEVRLVIVAEHGREVGRPVLVRINAANLPITVEVAVNGSSQCGELSYEVHCIFIDVLNVSVCLV